MRKDMQFRAFGMDVREVGDEGHFVGHSNIFGVKDSYGTIFDEGAFAKTIKDHGGMFPLLWFHDPRDPISLAEHSEDKTGLLVEGDIDLDIETGRRVHSGMKKGYISAMSIGFRVVTEAMEDEEWHIKEARLWESSMLTTNFAATPGAGVDDVRALPFVRDRILAMRGQLNEEELRDELELLLDFLQVSPDDGCFNPNEHSCDLTARGRYKKFRSLSRKSGSKAYRVILGQRKEDDQWEEQSYRYNKEVWSTADAEKHSGDHNGKTFEPAIGTKARDRHDHSIVDPEPLRGTLGIDTPSDAGEPGDHSSVRLLREILDSLK